jgi:hypothetical protein
MEWKKGGEKEEVVVKRVNGKVQDDARARMCDVLIWDEAIIGSMGRMVDLILSVSYAALTCAQSVLEHIDSRARSGLRAHEMTYSCNTSRS